MSFTGRQTGAIGIFYQIGEKYETDSLGEALHMLWTDYEHIKALKITCSGKDIDYSGVLLVGNGYKGKKDRK